MEKNEYKTNAMENRIQEYRGIDVFKFVMALLVVILHTKPFEDVNEVLNFMTATVLGRIAVPFFFAATGFLLQKKIEHQGKNADGIIKKYIFKIIRLYVIWTIVYLPIIIYTKVIQSEQGIKYGIFISIRNFIFNGSYGHLWYLPAAATGVFIVFFLWKRIGRVKTGIVVLLLFAAGLLTQSYFDFLSLFIEPDGMLWRFMKLVKKVMVSCRNGIFFGSICIYIGALAAEKKMDIRIKSRKAWIGLAVSLVLLTLEEAWLYTEHFVREEDMFLMLLPVTFFALMTASNLKVRGSTDFLRRMSTNLYLVHVIFWFVYKQFMRQYLDSSIIFFAFTLIGGLLTGYIVFTVQYSHKSHQND